MSTRSNRIAWMLFFLMVSIGVSFVAGSNYPAAMRALGSALMLGTAAANWKLYAPLLSKDAGEALKARSELGLGWLLISIAGVALFAGSFLMP